MSTKPPILISGAGLASLLLAQSLRKNSIPFKIFERDGSMSGRGQGYRLRMSDEGLDAIKSVLEPKAWDEFWETCGKTGGAGFVHYDAVTGEVVENKTGESLASKQSQIVGIARGDMRALFMKGCEEHISWNKRVNGYESTENGVRATFTDGTTSEEGSMLIGGDGISSKVAKQLSDGALKVFDTGARGIHGQAPTSAFKQLGEGVFRLVDESQPGGKVFIITNVRSNDKDDPNLQFGWTMVGQPGVIKAPGDNYSLVGKEAADLAKSITADWHPKFKPLFTEMIESEAAFWKITCSTSTGVPEWENDPRVTVIGDAVHSMTPAGGIGANTAVQDSALLGRLLGETGGYEAGLTQAYEKEMRVYGSKAVHQSYSMARDGMGIGELVHEV